MRVTTLLKVPLSVWVKQFYLANAGFFVFVFLFFFGMVEPGQLISYHLSLMEAMISSAGFLAVVCCGWLLYLFKCIVFCRKVIFAPESSYLFVLKTLSPTRQMGLYTTVSFILLTPVLSYACIVTYRALIQQHVAVACFLLTFKLILIGVSAAAIFIFINRNNIENRIQILIGRFAGLVSFRLRLAAFLPAWIFQTGKLNFAFIKISSLLLLSVSFIRNGDHFDADFFGIFFQLILTGHAMLMFRLVQFDTTELQFTRSLPIALYRFAAGYIFTAAIVMLPELGFMLINNHGNLPLTFIAELYLLSVAALFLYAGIALASSLDTEPFMLFVFMSFLMLFFLMKTGQHLLVAMVLFGVATSVFKSHFFSFEQPKK